MRIVEILLPRGVSDRSLSPQVINKIENVQHQMDMLVAKIQDPNTSSAGRDFLITQLDAKLSTLKGLIPRTHAIAEAVNKLPLTEEDFDLVKQLMERPIPAVVAPIYISEIINDDELNDQIRSLEENEPNRDVRPIIAEWFERVMPDQMYRFRPKEELKGKPGNFSVIHGYSDHIHAAGSLTGTAQTGNNAYGFR